MPEKDNVAQLIEARVLDPNGLSDEDKSLINTLTHAEVAALIRVREKVGDYSMKGKGRVCAWML